MSVIVFAGPTISAEEVRATLAADVRPPAKRGDILRATQAKPLAIGLIDGYFDAVPSVWHKEILWAMSEGIHVFGAASMGALRAAELSAFGMEGMGAIFEGYASLALCDDDEVAVAHADQDGGYRAASEALVNVRATLEAARTAGVIGDLTLEALADTAKRLHYSERTYASILAGQAAPSAETSALRDFLANGRVDQKKRDALLMLRTIGDRVQRGLTPKQVSWAFSHTDAWAMLKSEVLAEGAYGQSGAVATLAESGLVDELLLAGSHRGALDAAACRAACYEDARRNGAAIDPRAIEAIADEFRRERGLNTAAEFAAWLERECLTEAELVPFFRREALLRRSRATLQSGLPLHLTDHLRATGEYGALARAARAKRERLSIAGLDSPVLSDTKLSERELWQWYFRERLKQPICPSIEAFALRQGTTLERLRQAVIREYCDMDLRPSKTDTALTAGYSGGR